MHMSSSETPQGLLDDHFFGMWRDALRLLHSDCIPADKDNRHAIMGSYQRIDGRLTDNLTVDTHLPDSPRVVGMRENSMLGTNRAVITDKADSIKACVKPLHHIERLVLASDQRRLTTQVLRVQVTHMV